MCSIMSNKQTNFFTKYKEIILYFVFAVIMYLLNLLIQWINIIFVSVWIEENFGHIVFIQRFYLSDEPFKMTELVGSSIAVLITYILKFVLDKYIVFNKREKNLKQTSKEFSLYFIFAILTTLENIGIQFIMSNFIGTDYWISLLIALTTGYITKYFLDKYFVFKTRSQEKEENIDENIK